MKCIICKKEIERSYGADNLCGKYCLECATKLNFVGKPAKRLETATNIIECLTPAEIEIRELRWQLETARATIRSLEDKYLRGQEETNYYNFGEACHEVTIKTIDGQSFTINCNQNYNAIKQLEKVKDFMENNFKDFGLVYKSDIDSFIDELINKLRGKTNA